VIHGREAERAGLLRVLEAAADGTGGHVLVTGEPGMGKSSLLAEARASAKDAGLDVVELRGHTDPRNDFALAEQWLTTLAPGAGVDGRRASDWAAVITDEAILRSAHEPLVVIVDDLELAGDADLEVLALVERRLERMPISIIAACRPFRRVLVALTGWTHLTLDRLSSESSVALLKTTLGKDFPTAPLELIAEALEGNPLALRQASTLLSPEHLTGTTPLPRVLPVAPELALAWGAVLDSLPDATCRALVDLAVAGARPDVLAAMAQASEWDQVDLDEAVEAGIVLMAPGESPRFARRLIRDVTLRRTPIATLQATHRRAAYCCNDMNLAPRIVVDHLVQCVGTADTEVALALEQQAGRAEALDQLAVASDAWLASAMLSTTAASRTSRALRGMRLIILNGLDYPDTDALLDLLADEQLDGECALWVEWLRSVKRIEDDPESALTAQWATIRRARTAAPETLRGLLWDAAMNAWTQGDTSGGLRAAREYQELDDLLAASDAVVEPPWTGEALVAAALFQAGEVEESVRLRNSAMERAASIDPQTCAFDRLLSAVFLDDLLLDTSPESQERLIVCMQRATERSVPHACLCGIQAWRARARGDWSSARQLLAQGRPVALETRATGAQLGMAALAAELAALSGDDDALELERALLQSQAGRVGDRRRLASLDRAMGLRALAAGNLDEAVVFLSAAAGSPFLGRGLRDAVLPARIDLVEVLVRRGDPDQASMIADGLRPILGAMRDPLATAMLHRVDALTNADPQESYRAALEAHALARDPFEEARTHLLFGEFLRRSRQRSASRAELLEASRLFDALGARPWIDRAQGELRASGGTIHSSVDLGVLTPQEQAVAQAVAAGRSNREVAEALFLSPKTVEYHLGNVYRKLGVTGRGALTRRLVEDGSDPA
jgi:DNA-binding CsgD family transcriptional regulator